MINQQLLDYIKQQLQKNVSKEQIKSSLMNNGWEASDVEEGFNAIAPEHMPVSPIPPVSPSSSMNPIIQPMANVINPVVQPTSNFINPVVSPNIQPVSNLVNSVTDQQAFINKWSWGGLLLYVVYFIGSRNYKRAFLYFIGIFVPILDIWLVLKSGLRGRKLVWESGKWQDFESYKKRQKLLDKIGLVLLLINILVWVVMFVFGYFNSSKINDQTITPTVINQEANQIIHKTPPTQTPLDQTSTTPTPGTLPSDVSSIVIRINNSNIPITLFSKNTPIVWLDWQGEPDTNSCEAYGSWSGEKPIQGEQSIGREGNTAPPDLLKYLKQSGFSPVDPVLGKYLFGLKCSNALGSDVSSDEAIMFVK